MLEQNPDALGEVLDLSVENVERERAAGDFSVDLVAEEQSGDVAVIEMGRCGELNLGRPARERLPYRPETERRSHYFVARLAAQFDALIHLDETRAVEPLERTIGWSLGEPPATYPGAL